MSINQNITRRRATSIIVARCLLSRHSTSVCGGSALATIIARQAAAVSTQYICRVALGRSLYFPSRLFLPTSHRTHQLRLRASSQASVLSERPPPSSFLSTSRWISVGAGYPKKQILPVVQHLRNFFKRQDSEPAALWSQEPAARIVNNSTWKYNTYLPKGNIR